ncbi:ABC transporter permease [bacterium]|nr:ABC transporter permease [bacterium]
MNQELHTTTIEPPRGLLNLNWTELWHYRELLWFLSWRDIKIKYKQTLLGFLWAIIVPLVNMVIFGTIFGGVAGIEAYGLNSYLSYLAVLVPWHYFANSLTMSSQSMVQNSEMLTKIYFPRLFSPMSALISNLVDLVIGIGILLVAMAVFGVLPAATAIFLPLWILIVMLTALGTGLFFSALNVRYRDVRHMIPFLVQIWMYVTVLFPFGKILARWGMKGYICAINPMVGAVEGFRWLLMHNAMTNPATAQPFSQVLLLNAIGAPVLVTMLLVGLYYFKRTERVFADIV